MGEHAEKARSEPRRGASMEIGSIIAVWFALGITGLTLAYCDR